MHIRHTCPFFDSSLLPFCGGKERTKESRLRSNIHAAANLKGGFFKQYQQSKTGAGFGDNVVNLDNIKMVLFLGKIPIFSMS